MRTASLTHYDLDAVVSSIFAKKAFPDISYSKCGAYGKVDKHIEDIIERGYERLIITDLNLTPEQILLCLDNFEEIWYFDHHLASADHVIHKDNPKFNYYYTDKMSATALMYRYWIKNGGITTKQLDNLALLTDVFDMWRIKHKNFNEGYKLNDLFWRYNFFEFEKKYSDGFPGFTDEENDWLNKKKDYRKKTIEKSPQQQISSNSTAILLSDRSVMTDVQFIIPGEIFYIIYYSEDRYLCSIRVKPENEDNQYDVNSAIKSLIEDYSDELESGGGHRHAGGCAFNSEFKIDDVLDFIEKKLDPTLNLPF